MYRASARVDELERIDAYWRAANYLSAGQIYPMDNPLLREPLAAEHIKPRLLGHWGTCPGLNLIYAHVNRLIRAHEQSTLYICGPGHGGPAMVANAYLEDTFSEIYPDVDQSEAGLRELMRRFSFPGGIASHVGPEVPGSIHEGGELGYALAHAYGAAFDNPDLLVCCVIGDGEAETGALAASWHSNKFLNPVTDGAVLPILHLNGYKIAGPTVLARIEDAELVKLLEGYGHTPYVVTGDDPATVHSELAATLDAAYEQIVTFQREARAGGQVSRPPWPAIVLNTPKGWTGPREVDGDRIEGTFRAHQVPLADVRDNPDRRAQLESWLRSYRPEELFDESGGLRPDLAALAPRGPSRMSANPHANGGALLRELDLPDVGPHAVDIESPAQRTAEPTRVLGGWLAGVIERNRDRFRLFGPDETESNRLDRVFDTTGRAWNALSVPADDADLSVDGRVMEILSEHLCQGWLEGYLLTGRHGVFNSYEAFVHIIDSMFNQHAKWLKLSRELAWREPVAALNYLLSSYLWRQDHNGFSHQDPGFLDLVATKAEIIRIYLPPDANTLLAVTDHCLRSRHLVNVVVAAKNDVPVWLSPSDAMDHCSRGIGAWDWAGAERAETPDVVLACAGDVPTMETLAAAELLRTHLPDLAFRVVNVVDLMRLQPETVHPHGLPDDKYDDLFPPDRPTIFAFHGYPSLVHKLAYRRVNHDHLHVRGYQEEGTTTTPFDMVMRNDLDRFHLVMDVIDRVPGLSANAADVRDEMVASRRHAVEHTRRYGDDVPEIRDWTWAAPR